MRTPSCARPTRSVWLQFACDRATQFTRCRLWWSLGYARPSVEPLVDRRRTHASVHGSRVRCILQHAKRVRLVRCSKRLSDGRRLQPDNRHHRLDHVDWSMSVVIGCRICICLLLSPSTNDNSARESGPATSLSLMCIRHQKRTFRCPHRLSYSQQLHIANRGHARVVTWARVDVCCGTTLLRNSASVVVAMAPSASARRITRVVCGNSRCTNEI